MSEALLIQSVDTLMGSRDLGELAAGVAQLAQRALGARAALVVLTSSEGDIRGGTGGNASAELEAWAAQLLASSPAPGLTRSGELAAGPIDAAAVDLRGVLAVSLPDASEDRERLALLGALAGLTETCSAQILRRTLSDRAIQATRAAMARGLHDLCTPLNSLRLGLHLLEPALTTKDPAVAQRAHRAVDRMAALVTTMADALGKPDGGSRALRPSETERRALDPAGRC